MMSKASRSFIFGLVTLAVLSVQTVLFVPALKAQVLYGSVTGTVTDQSGAGVPKAHAVVTNRATGVAREADADDDGHYTITDVAPGEYEDRKSTRLNSSHITISYAVFCLKKKKI